MVKLTKITCENRYPHHKKKGQLALTILSFIGPGDYDTSIFTLNKTTGQFIFSHFYKDITYTTGVRPQVVSGRSVPFILSPGDHLYDIALSEMLTYARDYLRQTDNPKDEQKSEIFIETLQLFLTKQKTEVLK